MSTHRVNELIELLQPVWTRESHLNLMEMLVKLAEEAGFAGDIASLTDDTLIYHLKMRGSSQESMIPGIAKDVEENFKSAILKARGIQE